MERFERTPLEKCRQIDDAQRIPEIRLIGAKLKHCLPVTEHGIRRLCHPVSFRRKFAENRGQHFLAHTEYILLRGKTHLEIQLVELSR